jgi:hypothetical protein
MSWSIPCTEGDHEACRRQDYPLCQCPCHKRRADTGAMNENLPSKETRATLRLASQEAEQVMLRLVGICRPELFPADEFETLHHINTELEDASTRLYAMAVRGTSEPRD